MVIQLQPFLQLFSHWDKKDTYKATTIINNYLERPDRNLSKLMDFARKLRAGTFLEQYLQVKL